MPLQYKPTKYAKSDFGESLTEQEHKDSCDVNKMIRSAMNGQTINGSSSEPIYGHDDMTIDAVQHRINKAKAEAELEMLSKTQEFSKEELDLLPPKVKEKFKFKLKKAPTDKTTTIKTTTKKSDPEPEKNIQTDEVD